MQIDSEIDNIHLVIESSQKTQKKIAMQNVLKINWKCKQGISTEQSWFLVEDTLILSEQKKSKYHYSFEALDQKKDEKQEACTPERTLSINHQNTFLSDEYYENLLLEQQVPWIRAEIMIRRIQSQETAQCVFRELPYLDFSKTISEEEICFWASRNFKFCQKSENVYQKFFFLALMGHFILEQSRDMKLSMSDCQCLLDSACDVNFTKNDLHKSSITAIETAAIHILNKISKSWGHLCLHFSNILDAETLIRLQSKLTTVNCDALEHKTHVRDVFQSFQKFNDSDRQILICNLLQVSSSIKTVCFLMEYLLQEKEGFRNRVSGHIENVLAKTIPPSGKDRISTLMKIINNKNTSRFPDIQSYITNEIIAFLGSDTWPYSVDKMKQLVQSMIPVLHPSHAQYLCSVFQGWYTTKSNKVLLELLLTSSEVGLFLSKQVNFEMTVIIEEGLKKRTSADNYDENYQLLELLLRSRSKLFRFYDQYLYANVHDKIENLVKTIVNKTSTPSEAVKELIMAHILRSLSENKPPITMKTSILDTLCTSGDLLLAETTHVLQIVEIFLDDTPSTITLTDIVGSFSFWMKIFTCTGAFSNQIIQHKAVLLVSKQLQDLEHSLNNHTITYGDMRWPIIENETFREHVSKLIASCPRKYRPSSLGPVSEVLGVINELRTMKKEFHADRITFIKVCRHAKQFLTTHLNHNDMIAITTFEQKPYEDLAIKKEEIYKFYGDTLTILINTMKTFQSLLYSRIFYRVCCLQLPHKKISIGQFCNILNTKCKTFFDDLCRDISKVRISNLIFILQDVVNDRFWEHECQVIGTHDQNIMSESTRTSLWQFINKTRYAMKAKWICLLLNTLGKETCIDPDRIMALRTCISSKDSTTFAEWEQDLLPLLEIDERLSRRGKFHILKREIRTSKLAKEYFEITFKCAWSENVIDEAFERENIDLDINNFIDKCTRPFVKKKLQKANKAAEIHCTLMWNIIKEMAKAAPLMSFLKQIANEDLRQLLNFVEPYGEQWLKLIEIKRNVSPILKASITNARNIEETLHSIYLMHLKKSRKQTVQLGDDIKQCSKNTDLLKMLFNEITNKILYRNEINLQDIKSFIDDGEINLNWDENSKTCNISLHFDESSKIAIHTCSAANVGSILLGKTLIENSQIEVKNVEGKHDFESKLLTTVSRIKKLSDIFTELMATQFFEMDFEQVGPISKLEDKITKLRTRLQNWTKEITKSREKYALLNFFRDKHLRILEEFFTGSGTMDSVLHLLRTLCPSFKLPDEIKVTNVKAGEDDVSTRLQIIVDGLSQLFSGYKPKTKPIVVPFPSTPGMGDKLTEVQPGKIFIAHVEKKNANTVHVLMKLCYSTTQTYPNPSEILFCNRRTSWEAVKLLLKRCCRAPEIGLRNRLFLIVNFEELPRNTQRMCITELKRMHLQNIGHILLAIIYLNDHYSDTVCQFPHPLVHQIRGFTDDNLGVCLQQACPNVTVVTSQYSGLGKSTHILRQTGNNMDDIASVLIGGWQQKKDFTSALTRHSKGLKGNQKGTLHLKVSLMSHDTCKLFELFLFEYLVIGVIVDDTCACTCEFSQVYIEVANSFQNRLMESLPICNLLKRNDLKWNDFEDFRVSKDHSIVCLFQKALTTNTIDKRTVDINEILSEEDHREILRSIFGNQDTLTHTTVNIFLKLVTEQLRSMCQSGNINPERIEHIRLKRSNPFLESLRPLFLRTTPEKSQIMSDLVKTLFSIMRNITKRHFSGHINMAEAHLDSAGYIDQLIEYLDHIPSWSKIIEGHILTTFNKHKPQYVHVTCSSPEAVAPGIKQLFEFQQPDVSEFDTDSEDLKEQIEKICRRAHDDSQETDQAFIKFKETYVLTFDNMMKMILITIRINAEVPVIVMGHTGCGKTMLIKYLSHLRKVRLELFHVHAGIRYTDICNFMEKVINLAKKESDELWAFFDEINTCQFMGVLTEIICEKQFDGQTLPSNLVCLAACNPYVPKQRDTEQTSTESEDTAGLTIMRPEKDTDKPAYSVHELSIDKLVYRVCELSETMHDFAWNFGKLDPKDEQSYITEMIKDIPITGMPKDFKNSLKDFIFRSQIFINTKSSPSNLLVSLRDVNRLKHVLKWMTKYLERKGLAVIEGAPMERLKCNENVLRSIILSFYICYLIRLTNSSDRTTYMEIINDALFHGAGIPIPEGYVQMVIEAERRDLILRMKLPPLTAKNEALVENVFVLFVAIMTQTPLFIVGKPGSSKSLAVSIVTSNLKGTESLDEFLQTLPAVYIYPHQGSESSTSDDIIMMFERASSCKQKDGIPVVLIDEAGLADNSKNEPLKALHNLLDPDEKRTSNVSMVGLSNWALDPAKMNRAIYLFRIETNAEELRQTAKAIDIDNRVEGNIIDQLVTFFLKVKEIEKKQNTCQDLHGLRDFFALIKQISKNPEKENIEYHAILKNFGGLPKEKEKDLTCIESVATEVGIEIQIVKPTTVDMITESLKDDDVRHLMIISEDDSALHVFPKVINRNYEFFLCSKFQDDQSEEYKYRVLQAFIQYMQRDTVVVLKNLESVYGYLYDMLNQNYQTINGKLYCRIPLRGK